MGFARRWDRRPAGPSWTGAADLRVRGAFFLKCGGGYCDGRPLQAAPSRAGGGHPRRRRMISQTKKPMAMAAASQREDCTSRWFLLVQGRRGIATSMAPIPSQTGTCQ